MLSKFPYLHKRTVMQGQWETVTIYAYFPHIKLWQNSFVHIIQKSCIWMSHKSTKWGQRLRTWIGAGFIDIREIGVPGFDDFDGTPFIYAFDRLGGPTFLYMNFKYSLITVCFSTSNVFREVAVILCRHKDRVGSVLRWLSSRVSY